MSATTRDLLKYASHRLQMLDVMLVYEQKTLADDGSFRIVETETETRGYLVELSTTDIKRLREGGINITRGVTLTLAEEIEKIPDRVKHKKDSTGKYRKVSRVAQFSRGEGITNMILDTATMITDDTY